MVAPLARSRWLAGVDVIANPLQPKAQFLLFSKPPHSKTFATDLVEKKPEEPVWLWARVLWSCPGALALCSNHSKNYVPMWGLWCPLCAISILFGKNHNWRDFSALQFNPGISGGRGKKILGKNVPSSENYPVHNIVILLPFHRQPPLWRTAGFRPWVVLTALGVACRLCFVILTSSHKGGFHPFLCETTHLCPLIIS